MDSVVSRLPCACIGLQISALLVEIMSLARSVRVATPQWAKGQGRDDEIRLDQRRQWILRKSAWGANVSTAAWAGKKAALRGAVRGVGVYISSII